MNASHFQNHDTTATELVYCHLGIFGNHLSLNLSKPKTLRMLLKSHLVQESLPFCSWIVLVNDSNPQPTSHNSLANA